MRNATRLLFAAYVSQIALINAVEPDSKYSIATFTVAPNVEQKLEEVIKEGSEFLSLINIEPVVEQTGKKVGVGVTRTMAGRTNTAAGNRRNPTDPTDTSDKGTYFCHKTDYDSALSYARLDAWRHKPEFQTLISTSIAKQQGRDRIMIGWHGTSAAAATDRVANPLLQDVNIGWLEQIRDNAPAQHLQDGDLTVGPLAATKAIYIHADGDAGVEVDYTSIDALAVDARRLISDVHATSTDLVVIVGRDLVDDKYFNIVQKTGATATEVEATDRILRSEKQIGGMPAVMVPFFPANAMLITSLDNLSIYVQEGTRRRAVKDEPEFDRVATYDSVNEAYVVEDYEKVAFVENIVMGKKPA